MTKEKLLKLQIYQQKIKYQIEDAPRASKHKHNQKEYLQFLNNELKTVTSKINQIKLEMSNK